jgi:hypothetical protein
MLASKSIKQSITNYESHQYISKDDVITIISTPASCKPDPNGYSLDYSSRSEDAKPIKPSDNLRLMFTIRE